MSKNITSFLAIVVLTITLSTILLPTVAAKSGSIMAMSTTGENATTGENVEIFLEVRPGRGAIYIESTPLTKLDTQMSARLAVEAACERSKEDCRDYDFFYVIRTRGSVIGGPSAGAALSVLTYAVLEDLPIRNDSTITGSILSGGVIGPVGGVKEKTLGAAKAGYKAALVPAFEEQRSVLDEYSKKELVSDDSIYEQYGIEQRKDSSEDENTGDGKSNATSENHRITVIYIKTLDDAIEHFTGKAPKRTEPLKEPPLAYTENMERIATTLCDRALITRSSIDEEDERVDKEKLTESVKLYSKAMNSTSRGAFYTAASQCFGSSIIAQELLLATAEPQDRQNMLELVKKNRNSLREAIEKTTLHTITDLEVAMIATERLQDVERALQEINDSNPSPAQLAYATERFETARAWFSVVGSIRGTELDLSQEALDASCRLKLDEARERVNYASFLFPQVASQLEQSLRDALGAAQRQHSALCILQASQAKAEANSILTALSVPESGFEAVTQRKSAIARERIAAQTERGTFPVLAYSYSEYSESFPETDSATGALYTEYSLELSSLPSNFALENHFMRLDKTMLTVFILGAMLGAIIGLVGGFFLYRPPKARKR